MAFACALSEDFADALGCPDASGVLPGAVSADLVRLALARVRWRRMAETLLRHFTLPMLLASPAAKGRAGRIALPAAWRGPVN